MEAKERSSSPPEEPKAERESGSTSAYVAQIPTGRPVKPPKSNPKKPSQIERSTELIPGLCNFYVERKHRYCNIPPKNESLFCPIHLQSVGGEKRIPCPVDPTHFVYESRVEKHSRKCKKHQQHQNPPNPHLVADINAGSDHDEETEPQMATPVIVEAVDRRIVPGLPANLSMPEGDVPVPLLAPRRGTTRSRLSQLSDEDLLALLKKVEVAFEKSAVPIGRVLPLVSFASEEAKGLGYTSAKNVLQSIAILRHMKHFDRLNAAESIFVEWGAGRGGVTKMIYEELKTSKHVLIDRQTFNVRHRVESAQLSNFNRITADIKDLKLSTISFLKEGKSRAVSLSKHLCGPATDLTIRCLEQGLKEGLALDSFFVALCCHHRCEWKSYVNKAFMKEIGFSKSEFPLLMSLSSWATCKLAKRTDKVKEYQAQAKAARSAQPSEDDGPDGAEENDEELVTPDPHREGSIATEFTQEQIERWGKMAKRLLDIGRMRRLALSGFQTQLLYYAEEEVSPENVLLVAIRAKATEETPTNS